MALVQIGFQGQSGPVFTYDDGTLPANKLVLVKLSRDQYFNRKLVVLDPSYATFLRQISAGDFTYSPEDFVLGSYVSGQQLNAALTQYKYPVVLNDTWTGYKAVQNGWEINTSPFSADSNQTVYGVQDQPVTTTPTVINLAPTPTDMKPFIIGAGILIAFLILNAQKD